MFPFPSVIPAVVNHLLAQEPWAREQLRAHAGKIATLDAGLISVTWQVAPDGMLQAAPDAVANVTIRVKPADLPLVMQDLQRAVSYARVEGDADFANTISQLSQSLKWDAEADLSRIVGDIAAHRLVSGAKSMARSAQATGQAVTENLAEYFLEEQPMLVRAQAIADFAADIVRLRDDVERLDKRVRKLEG